MPFDRSRAKRVGDDVVAALQDFCKTHGLKVEAAGGKFFATEFTMKLRITEAVTVAGGVTIPAEQAEWNANCARFGFKPEHFGKRFSSAGRFFKIIGIRPSRYEYPITGEGRQGGRYKFRAADVLTGMGLGKPTPPVPNTLAALLAPTKPTNSHATAGDLPDDSIFPDDPATKPVEPVGVTTPGGGDWS